MDWVREVDWVTVAQVVAAVAALATVVIAAFTLTHAGATLRLSRAEREARERPWLTVYGERMDATLYLVVKNVGGSIAADATAVAETYDPKRWDWLDRTLLSQSDVPTEGTVRRQAGAMLPGQPREMHTPIEVRCTWTWRQTGARFEETYRIDPSLLIVR